MSLRLSETGRRVAEQMPGYLAVLAGAAVLSAVVLAPAHEALERTRWRRGVMALQASHLAEMSGRYERFHAAIDAGEPVLLERLAYAQLGLRPASKRSVPALAAETASGWRGDGVFRRGGGPTTQEAADLHVWVSRPLPRVGREISPLRPVRTRLARLASGSQRLGVTLAGGILILGGLLWDGKAQTQTWPDEN